MRLGPKLKMGEKIRAKSNFPMSYRLIACSVSLGGKHSDEDIQAIRTHIDGQLYVQ
eukprot:COSAG02_NODE_6346_length_3634_cov_4.485714_1_plen_56_part_00